MRQGTTPTHEFTVDFDIESGSEIRVIYAQKALLSQSILFVKEGEDCELVDRTISTTLSEHETFLFDTKFPGLAQIRIKLPDGQVMTSEIIKFNVQECLEEFRMGTGGES